MLEEKLNESEKNLQESKNYIDTLKKQTKVEKVERAQ
jgi:hypothetical protein